jgi:hypothetical protein
MCLLKGFLHNRDDAQCACILAHGRCAMPPVAQRMLIERVRPLCAEASDAGRSLARTDINLLLGRGGRERSKAEFERPLRGAGFGVAEFRATALD